MPKEPSDFDCRSASKVLRLRFRDWMWPTALAIVVAIPVLNHSDWPRSIGPIAFSIGVFGPWIWIGAIAFAGVRWCSIGRLRPRGANQCARCGYPTTGLDDSDPASRCPECGAGPDDRRTPTAGASFLASIRGASISRWLIDLPGLLGLLFAIFMFTMLMLIVFGIVVID